MKTIELRTYRIKNDENYKNVLNIGIRMGKEGFIYQYSNEYGDIYFTNEPLPFDDFDDELSAFESKDEPVTCNHYIEALDDLNYGSVSLSDVINDVFYSRNTEIKLPRYDIVLKVSNYNFY